MSQERENIHYKVTSRNGLVKGIIITAETLRDLRKVSDGFYGEHKEGFDHLLNFLDSCYDKNF